MKIDSMSIFEPYFETQDYFRGRQYYYDGRVSVVDYSSSEKSVSAVCAVKGSRCYTVTLDIDKVGFECSCTCGRYNSGYTCKHIAASLFRVFEVERTSETGINPNSDSQRISSTSAAAKQLLQGYLDKVNLDASSEHEKTAGLKPILVFDNDSYPQFRFSVGIDRYYIVQSIDEFARLVYSGSTRKYGKSLTLDHSIENFDATSQKLIRIILDEYPQYRNPYNRSVYGYYGSYRNYDRRFLYIEGSNFNRLFDLYCDTYLEQDGTKQLIKLEVRDPKTEIELSSREGGIQLKVGQPERYTYFGDRDCLYALSDKELLRCSPKFSSKVYPLISASRKPLAFANSDLPTLCDCVLSGLDGLVEVQDEDNIVAQYQPHSCTPMYYFDIDSDLGLVCSIKYRYGDEIVSQFDSPKKDSTVRRNKRLEQQHCQPIEQNFGYDHQAKRYCIGADDVIIEFMTEKLGLFYDRGEVYISDALGRRRISTAKQPTVGISVSEGMLTLNLDACDYPPEELEALYQSLLKKKKYHRLTDGRYLPLDGSSYETLAELVHMTQLSAEELKQGTVAMPSFRALYLEKLIGQNNHVQVESNIDYKRLIRDFKSVEYSEHQIPTEMEKVLRPYQRIGFQWLKTLEQNGFGGILADEMGLGKTVQIIAYLLTATREQRGLPTLIVCPASLILNWSDELTRFAPSLSASILLGTAAERRQMIENDGGADVWVTSYDLLKRDIKLYEDKQFYCCILDEAQNIKNQSTLASKSVKKIVCKQRFVLTGTPIENRLSELWNIFDFLMPGYLFGHSTFVNRLEKPIVQNTNADAQRQLSLLVQPFMLRRLKKDVLKELPPKVEHIRRITLDESERKVYQAAAHAALSAAEQTKESIQILALLTRLRQICCDPAICFENYQGESSKLTACIELCTSMVTNGHQMLVFSQFTTMLDRIREKLSEQGIKSFTIEGATPKEKRAQLVKDFNAGKAPVFLISLKAGGTGLNLTGADVVIHYDPWWNLAAQNQATDRAHRIGQQNSVQVYKLIAQDTIEERILALQEKKASLMDAISGSVDSEPLSREELIALLS